MKVALKSSSHQLAAKLKVRGGNQEGCAKVPNYCDLHTVTSYLSI